MPISLVIPVHNEESFLGPCLDAALAQDEPFHEIIVVNNSSTDRTADVLSLFGDRVRMLDERRPGVLHARTTGMDAATGTLIGRIDADSRLPADWSARVRRTFEDPAVQAVTGPAAYYDVRLAALIDRGDDLFRRVWSARMDWLFGANMAVRAVAWRAVRGSLCGAADVHEDLDLGLHLHAAGLRIAYEPGLRAGTSARRIADSFGDYRDYLRMTEIGYRRHHRPYARAWVTNRLLLALHPPLRRLHARAVGADPRARENPVRPGAQ